MSAIATPRRGSIRGQQNSGMTPRSASRSRVAMTGNGTSSERSSRGSIGGGEILNSVKSRAADANGSSRSVSGRRSSTGDLRLGQGSAISQIQVRPRDDGSILLPGKPQGQVIMRQSSDSSGDSTLTYVIDKQYKDFEKSLVRDATTAIQNNPGVFITCWVVAILTVV
jgi:hypothetical protein